MNCLVDTFDHLRLRSGQPDIKLRRAQLTQLLEFLTLDETRFLQEDLRGRCLAFDGISHLPPEIKIHVSDYLDVYDLVHVRAVSRAWRDCWTEPGLCMKLLKQHFRRAYASVMVATRAADHDHPLERSHDDLLKQEIYVRAINKLYSVRRGNHFAMISRRYDGSILECGSASSGRAYSVAHQRYSNGRVGWIIDGAIKIISLATGQIETILLPDRGTPCQWEISERYVVVMLYNSACLHVWDLTDLGTNTPLQTIRLPSSSTVKLSLHDERIVVADGHGDVYLYKIDTTSMARGSLVELRPGGQHIRQYSLYEVAAIFHPDAEDILFLVTLTCDSFQAGQPNDGHLSWNVSKYDKQMLKSTKRFQVPLTAIDHSLTAADHDFTALLNNVVSLSIRKIDDNGTYSLGALPLRCPGRDSNEASNHKAWDRLVVNGECSYLSMLFTFNIYTETHGMKHFRLPQGLKDAVGRTCALPSTARCLLPDSYVFWSDQVLLPVTESEVQGPFPWTKRAEYSFKSFKALHQHRIKPALIMAINSCDREERRSEPIRYIVGENRSDRIVYERKDDTVSHHLGPVYVWSQDLLLGIQEHNRVSSIRGDGNYVVMFRQNDFLIWTYASKSAVVHNQQSTLELC